MKNLSVTEAIRTRRAVRVFKDDPVPEQEVRDILAQAGFAPSNSNLQPWRAYVVSGAALGEFLRAVNEGLYTDGKSETPSFPTYPKGLVEPYRTRRYDCGERMYAALGIAREDKPARIKQVMKNFQFFGAPVGIMLTMHESMDMGQAMDIGIYAQNIMLLARERGLDTCPQVSWTQFPERVRKALDIPGDERVMLGIALGYSDDANPVNHLDHPRADLDEFASLRGF
jgi:nitroreductase